MSLLTRWPLPALLTWLGCWLLYALLLAMGAPVWLAMGIATLSGALVSVLANVLVNMLANVSATGTAVSGWRRIALAAGFPLSLLLSGTVALPAWAWLLPLLLVALVYPQRAWRDAPLFPTPVGALQSLAAQAPLADGARVLDAGCGLGHGLRALRQAYPRAALEGIEWSWPLAWLCRLQCPWARVRRGDMWQDDWSRYDLVYLFQRPETMPRAAMKAQAELKDGAWLVSLEFAVPGWQASAVLQQANGKPVWLYCAPFIEA